MRFVIITNLYDLKTRPDKLDYYFMEYLKKYSKKKIILCENNELEFEKNIDENDILIVFGCQPNLNNYPDMSVPHLLDLA